MDETIDLRPYIDALVRRWWVILGAVIAGILIAAFLHFSSSNYRATALIVVADPTQRLQFDMRVINTVDLDNLTGIYPEIAASDSVFMDMLDEVSELSSQNITTLPQLRERLSVETGGDSRVIRLIARYEDPEVAADLANLWARTFVSRVDEVYFGQSGQIEFYEDLKSRTSNTLQEIEQELVNFQSGSRMAIVDNTLLSMNELQASYLADQRRLSLLLDDVQTLSNQVEAGTGDTVTWADQLTALMLQIRVYEDPSTASAASAPIQLQVDPQSDLLAGDREELLSLLSDLAQSAESSLAELDVKLLGLEPRIFELQREKESLSQQYDELTRDREVTRETYLTLARKVDEVRVQTEDTGNSLRVASLAATPSRIERSNLVVTAAVAAAAALLISAAVIILMTWWRSTTRRPAA